MQKTIIKVVFSAIGVIVMFVSRIVSVPITVLVSIESDAMVADTGNCGVDSCTVA